MKDNEFNLDNIIKFKSLADKIQNVSNDELDEDDFVATEALCAIECLIADIVVEDEEPILKKVETMINKRN